MGSHDGNFSLKSSINIIRAHMHGAHDPIWAYIWKALVPQCVRFFLWLAGHDRIMSNSNMFSRGLTTDPSCRNCLGVEKTSLHILWDCPLARVIWEGTIPGHLHNMFFLLPLRPWLGYNLKPSCDILENWPTSFAIAVWKLWKLRNKRVFEDPNFTPYRPQKTIKKQSKEILKALVSNPSKTLSSKSEILIR